LQIVRGAKIPEFGKERIKPGLKKGNPGEGQAEPFEKELAGEKSVLGVELVVQRGKRRLRKKKEEKGRKRVSDISRA